MLKIQPIITIISVSLLIGLTSFWLPAVALADSLQITASVPATPDQFQLDVSGPSNQATFSQGSILTYHITFGSYLSAPTDMVAVEISWSLGTIVDSQQQIPILEYESASSAFGSIAPQVDTANRKVTWTISPMPPTTGNQLTLTLRLNSSYTGTSLVSFLVNSRLIGPGVNKIGPALSANYQYVSPTPSPTPTVNQTSPSATPIVPAVSPTEPPKNNKPSAASAPPSLIPLDVLDLIPAVGSQLHQAADQIQKVAQHDGGAITFPLAFPFIGILISLIVQLLPYISWWQIPGLLLTLLFHPKRRAWGVVYDQVTKLPLDPVIVELQNEKGELFQTITDFYGRYQFLVGPGKYTLTAKKTNYVFPSVFAQNKPETVYEDRYLGGPITLDQASSINVNIPMDPLQPDWNQTQKTLDVGMWRNLWPKLQKSLFSIGIITSLVMTVLSPTIVNMIICAGYAVALVVVFIYRQQHPWGVVSNNINKPLAGSVVSIVDVEHPTVKRPPVVTNETGRYNFLVEGGKYQVNVALPQGPGNFSEPIPGPTFVVPGNYGAIHQDLEVEE